MNPESFPCQLISWDEAYRLSQNLAKMIKSSGFRPDLVVAIGRGGYVPARIVCDILLHSLLTSIKIEHWDIAACKRPEALVRFPLAVDASGQKILIVDDVTDTGDTLRAAIDYVRSLGACEIKTAVMQHKTTSTIQPDFFADLVAEWRWIIYPWAAYEDLLGFTQRVLSSEPASVEQIGSELMDRFSLVVDCESLTEILADLVEMKKAEKFQDMYRKI
jgi:hypoxanthine phosphoribosyltransferase